MIFYVTELVKTESFYKYMNLNQRIAWKCTLKKSWTKDVIIL